MERIIKKGHPHKEPPPDISFERHHQGQHKWMQESVSVPRGISKEP